MKIWLITIGEPLPISGDVRLLRTGIFANYLHKSGHNLVWWTSTFNHIQKKHIVDRTKQNELTDRFKLILLKGSGYKKNISLARLYDHHILGRKFAKFSKIEERPDVILCSFPSIELASEAVKYGQKYNVPVVVDIRDLWPDIFVNALPMAFQWAGKFLLLPLFRLSDSTLKNCTAITGVSENYMQWGLRKACREKSDFDRVFHLGYPAIENESDGNKMKNHVKEMGINSDKKIFLFIGSFGHTYDLIPVIKGAEILQKHGADDIQFVFCGDGERMGEWQTEAESIKNIVFTGWVNQDVLRYLLSHAYVGLAAYAIGAPQGIPNKIIEYMSTGLPVLSSLTGESEKLLAVTNTGAVYTPGDSVSFVHEVLKLLDPKKRNVMSINSLSIFTEQFEATKVFGEMARYLMDVVGKFQKDT